MGDFVSYGQMLLPMLYHLADVFAFINVVVVGKTLHHLYDLLLPSGKMEQPLFFVLKLADVFAMWQDGKATFVLKLADVIAR